MCSWDVQPTTCRGLALDLAAPTAALCQARCCDDPACGKWEFGVGAAGCYRGNSSSCSPLLASGVFAMGRKLNGTDGSGAGDGISISDPGYGALASPPPPPSRWTVAVTFTVAGDVSSFDRAGFERRLLSLFPKAKAASVSVSAASVRASSSLLMATADDAAEAAQTLRDATPATLSAQLGVTVEAVSTPTILEPGAPTSPPPPGGAGTDAADNAAADGVAASRRNVEVVVISACVGLALIICLLGCGCYRFYDRSAAERSRRVHPRTAADRAAERAAERRKREEAVAPKVHMLPQLSHYDQNYAPSTAGSLASVAGGGGGGLEGSSAMRWAASCGASTSRLGSPAGGGHRGAQPPLAIDDVADADDDRRDVVSAGGIVFDEVGASARKPTHADAASSRAGSGGGASSKPTASRKGIAASQRALLEAAARRSANPAPSAPPSAPGPSGGAPPRGLRDRRGVAAAEPLQLDGDDFLDPNPPPPRMSTASSSNPVPMGTRPASRGMSKSNSSFLIRRVE